MTKISKKIVLTEAELVSLLEDAFDAGRTSETGYSGSWTDYKEETLDPFLEAL